MSRRTFRERFAALARPAAAIETVVALGLFVLAISQAGIRRVAFAVLAAAGDAIAATTRAAAAADADATGFLALAAWAALIALLVGAPLVRLGLHLRPPHQHRRAWLPLVWLVFLLALPMSFPALSTPAMVIALVAASIGGLALAARPRWRVVALAPLGLLLEPMLGHSPLADLAWPTARTAARCARNDGRRADGFTPDQANPRYYGISPFGDDLVLLTGDRVARWMRHEPGRLQHVAPSEARGNLWQGCVLDDRLWLTKRGVLLAMDPPRLGPGGTPSTNSAGVAVLAPERITRVPLADPPGRGVELDLVDAVCDPAAHAVYVTELLGGGLRVIATRPGGDPGAPPAITYRDLGVGRNLQLVRRGDGRLVGIDTAYLYVYDPRADRIEERLPAGVSALGVDLCPLDDGVAVADLAGRLRLFSRTAGGYRFTRARSLGAPRRVAFSPDCRRLAITSGDDRTVWILGRDDLSIVRELHVGPGLRDLVYLAPAEVAAADACGAELLDGGE